MTTVESATKPSSAALVGFFCQLLATRPALTTVFMSGINEKFTTSAGWPAATSWACVPEAPKEFVNVTPCPAGVASKAVSSAVYAVEMVEYPTTATVSPDAPDTVTMPSVPRAATSGRATNVLILRFMCSPITLITMEVLEISKLA